MSRATSIDWAVAVPILTLILGYVLSFFQTAMNRRWRSADAKNIGSTVEGQLAKFKADFDSRLQSVASQLSVMAEGQISREREAEKALWDLLSAWTPIVVWTIPALSIAESADDVADVMQQLRDVYNLTVRCLFIVTVVYRDTSIPESVHNLLTETNVYVAKYHSISLTLWHHYKNGDVDSAYSVRSGLEYELPNEILTALRDVRDAVAEHLQIVLPDLVPPT